MIANIKCYLILNITMYGLNGLKKFVRSFLNLHPFPFQSRIHTIKNSTLFTFGHFTIFNFHPVPFNVINDTYQLWQPIRYLFVSLELKGFKSEEKLTPNKPLFHCGPVW